MNNTNFENGRLLVSITDAGALLSLSRGSIYKLVHDGQLRVIKIGKAARISMDNIREFVAAAPAYELAA
jgi:excisionase family DNA binding protein